MKPWRPALWVCIGIAVAVGSAALITTWCNTQAATLIEEDGIANAGALVNRSSPNTDLYAGFRCTVTLLDKAKAVTAAHCVRGTSADELQIVVGQRDLCSPLVNSAKRIDVEKIILSKPNSIDLAVLILDPLQTSLSGFSTRTAPDATKDLFAVGWGSRAESGNFACEIQVRRLQRTSSNRCSWAESAPPGTFVCAVPDADFGSGNTCHGDSGGPLFSGAGTRSSLVAMTLSGNGCGAESPGLYLTASRIFHATQ